MNTSDTSDTSDTSSTSRRHTRITFAVLAFVAGAVISVLLPTSAADASQYQYQYYSSGPCPWFAIQDVFDDPSSDWDNDGVSNSDELYNGLKPCVADTATFCGSGGNPLCRYRYVAAATPCQVSVASSPHADYDGDGIRNGDEVRNGADPCSHPCPYPTYADLSLNPNADWDRDGFSNAVEVNRGTDPCDGYSFNPCPHWSVAQVNRAPNLDWDGDWITNAHEVRAGSNPCAANVTYRPALPVYTYVAPKPVYVAPPPQRLPHVTYAAPAPVRPTCPYGYPYYHPGNGKCYANPVGYQW